MLPRRSTPLALLLVALTLVALSAAPPAQAGIPERILSVARAELNKGVREIPAGSDNSPRHRPLSDRVRLAGARGRLVRLLRLLRDPAGRRPARHGG